MRQTLGFHVLFLCLLLQHMLPRCGLRARLLRPCLGDRVVPQALRYVLVDDPPCLLYAALELVLI